MNQFLKRGILLIGLVVLTGVLASCGLIRSAAQVGDVTTFSADQNVFMHCSADCRAQKQCGNLAEDNATVIFIHNSRPATKDHTGLLGQNTMVTVREIASKQMVLLANNQQQSQLNWYKVGFQDVNNNNSWTDGWVAGWCLVDSAQ